MSKNSKNTKKNVKKADFLILHEKVDTDILERLITAEGLSDKIKTQLKKYNSKRCGDKVCVKYWHGERTPKKGRFFAELGLQGFKRNIRGALANKYYYDIDMENSAPRAILQYCERHNIDCPKLKEYVKGRDIILNEIKEFHNVSREEAKLLMLRMFFLGNYVIDGNAEQYIETLIENEFPEPKKKLKFLQKFQAELYTIVKEICKLETEMYEAIKKDNTKTNKKATLLCDLSHIIENNCLMAMKDFFEKKGHTVGVLCFDGLMVEKSQKLDEEILELITKCEKYVKKITNYSIKLAVKPMETELGCILPQFSAYVDSDLGCQEKLFKIEGSDKFKYCKEELYIFDERTGMYDTDIHVLFYYLTKNRQYLNIIVGRDRNGNDKCENYGTTTRLQRQVIQHVKTASHDNDWMKKNENSSLGYLLFKDGIYNMKTGEFSKGFDPKIVFFHSVPWNFPKYDKDEVKYAYDISFGKLFNNPKAMISTLACALAGDVTLKRFIMAPGKSNAGKSRFLRMLMNSFGDYIGTFNAESLAEKSSNDTKDEAASMRWAYLLRHCRIILSSEVCMKRKLNGNCIKKLSGGDDLVGRQHAKNEKNFQPHFTAFCMINDVPKIDPLDEAVKNRLIYNEFPFIFVDKSDIKNNNIHKPKDKDLDRKIVEEKFIRGFIHILLDEYKDYLENGEPEFDREVKNKWIADDDQKVSVVDKIKEYYDITNKDSDRVSVQEMKNFKEKNKKDFSSMSVHRFNDVLREELGLQEGRDANSRFWKGITKKEVNFELD